MTHAQPPDGETARLFLALWPDDALRRAVAQWRDAWRWPATAALVAPGHFHLTLHFLGNVPVSRLPELTQPGSALEVGCAPFTLSLGDAGLWPHGIAVLQPHAPDAPDSVPPPLARLHDALKRSLTGLDLPTENRAYRPHITLARHAQAAVPPAHRPGLQWPVEGYALVRSWPGKDGGYSVIRRYGC